MAQAGRSCVRVLVVVEHFSMLRWSRDLLRLEVGLGRLRSGQRMGLLQWLQPGRRGRSGTSRCSLGWIGDQGERPSRKPIVRLAARMAPLCLAGGGKRDGYDFGSVPSELLETPHDEDGSRYRSSQGDRKMRGLMPFRSVRCLL